MVVANDDGFGDNGAGAAAGDAIHPAGGGRGAPPLPLGYQLAARLFCRLDARRVWRQEIVVKGAAMKIAGMGGTIFTTIKTPDGLCEQSVQAIVTMIAPFAGWQTYERIFDLDDEWLRQTHRQLERQRQRIYG